MERSPYADDIETFQQRIDEMRKQITGLEQNAAELLLVLQDLKRLDAERQGHRPRYRTGKDVGLKPDWTMEMPGV